MGADQVMASAPPLPEGFVLDAAPANTVAPPPGFVADPPAQRTADGRLIVDINGGEETPPQTGPAPTMLESAGHGAGLFARGLLRGVGQLADLISTPIAAADGLTGGPGYKVTGSDAMDRIADALSLPKEESGFERFTTNGLAGAATGLGVGGPLGGLRALLPEALAGFGAGGGQDAAKEAGFGPTGQTVAAVLGGLTPAGASALIKAAHAGGGSAADVAKRIIDSLTHGGAQNRASANLQNAATKPVSEIVDNIANRPPATSGASPTLAEVAQDPGLAGFQRGHANTDMATAATIGDRNAANALARTRAASEAMGDGSPQAIQDVARADLGAAEAATARQQAERQAAVDARIAAEQTGATEGADAANAGLSQAREQVGPLVDRAATGTEARTAFDDAYQAAKARTREAYGDPVLKQPQPVTIPQSVFQKLRHDMDEFYGDGGGEIPARLKAVLDDMADPHATTRTLTNIDRRLADFAGEATMQGRRAEGAFAERVRSNLGDFVNQNAPQEYRDALKAAKAVRAEQGRIFETGSAPTAFAKDKFGNPTVGDTTVPSRLVRPGAPGGDTIDGLIASIGAPAAENAVRHELRRSIEEGAVTTEAQARSLATRFGEVAKRFPGVAKDLEELQAHAAKLDTAKKDVATAQSARPTFEEVRNVKDRAALHDEILASPLGRVADPSVDPSSFVHQLLKRADDGRQLNMLAKMVKKSPAATGGLRRALGDFIVNAGQGPNFTAVGERVPSINKTRQAISTVISRAGNVLEPSQKLVLKLVQRELETANFAATASKPAGSETMLNQSFKELIDAVPAVPGHGMVKSMLGRMFSGLSNDAEVKRLITQSMLDPDFAATLLKRPTPAHWLKVQKGMLGTGHPASPAHIGRLSTIVANSPAMAGQARELQGRLVNSLHPERLAAQPAQQRQDQ